MKTASVETVSTNKTSTDNEKTKKNIAKHISLFALFILLNLASKFNRFIISFLNKSYDQKTINKISYVISISAILLLMIVAFSFNTHQRIKSINECKNIDKGTIEKINSFFGNNERSKEGEKINEDEEIDEDEDLELENDNTTKTRLQKFFIKFNNNIKKACKNNPKRSIALMSVVHTISPVISIIIAILISEKIFKSQNMRAIFIIGFSIFGVLTSIFVHFFINWVTSYIRQHNAEKLTSQLNIFPSNQQSNEDSNVEKNSNAALKPILAGCRTLGTSASYIAYIIIIQIIQDNNIQNNLLIGLICILCVSSAIQIYDIGSSCFDYKATMMEIDNKLNIIDKAREIITNREGLKELKKLLVLRELEEYKKNHCNNRDYFIITAITAIALFAIGEIGSLVATCLEKYKIIDEKLSLAITLISFLVALLSTLLYCIYLPKVSEKQSTLMEKINRLSILCGSSEQNHTIET